VNRIACAQSVPFLGSLFDLWTPPTSYVDSPTSYVDSTHCTKWVHDWVSGLIWSGLRWKLMGFTLSFCSVQSKSGALLFISRGVICSSHRTVDVLSFQLDIGTITLESKPFTVYSTWNCKYVLVMVLGPLLHWPRTPWDQSHSSLCCILTQPHAPRLPVEL